MAFLFKLETKDGLPAEPPTLSAAVPNWSPGDVIALGAGRALRVVAVRDEDADQPPVLVVEDAGQARYARLVGSGLRWTRRRALRRRGPRHVAGEEKGILPGATKPPLSREVLRLTRPGPSCPKPSSL
jgi:hypothetical protein